MRSEHPARQPVRRSAWALAPRLAAAVLAVALLVPAGAAIAQELPPGGTFVDDNGSIHEPDIEAIAAEGITRGCNPPLNDQFCPGDPVSRGQMAAFLVRALGLPTVPGSYDPFDDDDGSIFEDDIERLAQAGITRGCDPPANDRFCADEPVSRAQMAAFLVRAYGYPAAHPDADPFTDDAGTFEHEIEALAAADVTRGCTEDRFCPREPVTRAQMATFLLRAEGLSPITPPPAVEISLEEVATGLSSPVYVTAPEGDDRVFIVEKTGRIKILDDGAVRSTPFLDISSGHGLLSDGERGLLSMAFHPDYASNGRFFIYYSRNSGSLDHQSVIAEYTVSSNPDVASPTADEILVIDQPASNHNGGQLLFGPDGNLYVALGDGGGTGGQHAQDTDTWLGSILRLDVSTPGSYTSPPGNPFTGSSQSDEIFAYGLRNPWRIWFDGGLLYVADVGQESVEEVSVIEADQAGANFGWNRLEGTRCYPSGSNCSSSGTVLPVAELLHSRGACSITGGVVYRGSEIPQLTGRYLYTDLCDGTIRYLVMDGTDLVGTGDLDDEIGDVSGVWSFGVDATGEVYIVQGSGTVSRLTGG